MYLEFTDNSPMIGYLWAGYIGYDNDDDEFYDRILVKAWSCPHHRNW